MLVYLEEDKSLAATNIFIIDQMIVLFFQSNCWLKMTHSQKRSLIKTYKIKNNIF